ncbi:hypothetical protein KC363_g3337 [Hortaea werneckii]|uniref:MACPF domain-containing protein n=1 Tax=Hortaea werneckii TaxID=91943 RepID=A0A3M7FTJ2_HORWE|nr:hypothetical protein KC361_g7211 [Hortaea werneckii]KAI7192419.1 hypothetical protein KC363_g3337 [Hortaea werneckii]RMY91714.1 hypothetical protein D0861_02890 [Hortaea werneckii]
MSQAPMASKPIIGGHRMTKPEDSVVGPPLTKTSTADQTSPEGVAKVTSKHLDAAASKDSFEIDAGSTDSSQSVIKQDAPPEQGNNGGSVNGAGQRGSRVVIGGHRAATATSESIEPTGGASGPSDSDKDPGKAPTDQGQGGTHPAPPSTTAGTGNPTLKTRPFVIKASFLHSATPESPSPTAEATGSILSKTLDDNVLSCPLSDASGLPLSVIRKLIPAMSRFRGIHKFCTESGVVMEDETLCLGDYLAIEPTEPNTANGAVPTVQVYYRTPSRNPVEPVANAAQAPTINNQMSVPQEGLKAQLKPAELRSMLAEDKGVQPKAGVVASAGTLDEAKWGVVLRNCAVFFGWVIDPKTREIRRAPKAAFQLRSKPEAEHGDETNSELQAQVPAANETSPSESTSSNISTQPQAALPEPRRPATVSNMPSTVQQADAIAKEFLAKGQSEEAAAKPKATVDADLTNPKGEIELPSERMARLAAAAAAEEAAKSKQQTVLRTSVLTAGIPPKAYNAIPNFRVNDDSKIDITVCKHELSMSMAKNDFSSQSTEASISGGFAGITAGVSAGYASSKSSGHEETSTDATQTMVARYMYPRCDLFLTAGDLEPTPEFASLLETIRTTKSIRALRRLQADFGQLFCQQLTLGARLLSTQTMSTRFKGSTDEQKEQFKVSVGVSVSTPYGGASVKHEQEKGSSSETKRSETTSNESNVFEAVGGDTILANNPNAWASTVSSPETWRVINREGLSSLVEMVAQMPGYAPVQSWFVQAVPALSKYMTVGDSHTVTCRLKVVSPTNSLHVKNENGKARHYLGFQKDDVVSPCQNTTDTTIINGQCPNFWIRLDYTVERRLFEPQTFRAPVLRGFDNYDVGGNKFGSQYSEAFAAVTWDIIAPFADVLAHGTRIILRARPTDEKAPVSHMTVFRTAQGEFVPGMSDRDEYQYWRLLKTGDGAATTAAPQPGEPIQAGDEIRLAWSFKDQTTGYRDYVDDVFGRRQTNPPAEIPTTATGGSGSDVVLYLKVPWPRFENSGRPTAMIMCADASTKEIVTDIQTARGRFKYALQDLRFRLDAVPNGGKGDSEDYLLQGVVQEGDTPRGLSLTVHQPGNAFQMQTTIFGFGIWN